MQRPGLKLKPLAPRPAQESGACFPVGQPCLLPTAATTCGAPCSAPPAPFDVSGMPVVNKNAFVGANLGVPASPWEAITSMDPKDYCYAWGPPCHGWMMAQPGQFYAMPGMYGYPGQPQMAGYMAPVSGGFPAASSGLMAGAVSGTTQLQTQLSMESKPDATTAGSSDATDTVHASASDNLAVCQALSIDDTPVDDLLVGLDADECLKFLEESDNPCSTLGDKEVGSTPGSPCGHHQESDLRQSTTPSDNSTADVWKVRIGDEAMNEEVSTTEAELLDLGFDAGAVLRHCGSFGELDMLTSIPELEASSSLDLGILPVTEAKVEQARARNALKRTKSLAGLSFGVKDYNPLLNLGLEDALQTINEFLKSDTRAPAAKRNAAMAAITALHPKDAKPGMETLVGASIPKRKRSTRH